MCLHHIVNQAFFMDYKILLHSFTFQTACSQGDIRLVAGSAGNEGRVEVCNQNQWGSVCDMGWDLSDAMVACRHAGYSGQSSSK